MVRRIIVGDEKVSILNFCRGDLVERVEFVIMEKFIFIVGKIA